MGRVRGSVAIQFSRDGKWIFVQRPSGGTRPIHAWAELTGELMGIGEWRMHGDRLSIEVNVMAWLHALQSFNTMHVLRIQLISTDNGLLLLMMKGQADEHAVEHQLRVTPFNGSNDWQPSVPIPTLTLQLTEVSSLSYKLQRLTGDKVWLKGGNDHLQWTIPQTGMDTELVQSQLPSAMHTGDAEVCLRRTDVIRAMTMWAVEAGAAPLMLSLVHGKAAIWMVTLGATQQLLDEEAPVGTLCMVLPHMILD